MKTATRSAYLCVALSAAILTLNACNSSDNDDAILLPHDHQVETTYGTLSGTDDTGTAGVVAWLGVPFAQAGRWSEPEEPDSWTGVTRADDFGSACVQHGRIYGPGANNTYDETIATTLNQAVGSEDCLNLNIWRPDSDATDLPVIVFFYGGSNQSGYNADPGYNGAELAKKANAVVVTPNYRVGIMGWLRLAQLQNDDTGDLGNTGNFGTLDTIKALEYLNQNIAAFGGNPDNVTTWGQSAGAVNVFALMASPLAKGLFDKAVPLSGGATSVPSDYSALPSIASTASHERYANTLLYALLIDSSDPTHAAITDTATAAAYVDDAQDTDIEAFLRSKTPSELFATALKPRPDGLDATADSNMVAPGLAVGMPGSPPIPEGTVIPVDLIATFKSGDFNNVPVLMGNARDEGKLFGTLPPVVFGGGSFVPLYRMSDADRFMAMMNFDPNAAVPNTTLEEQVHELYLPIVTPPGTVSGQGDYNDWAQIYGRVIFTDVADPLNKGVAAEALDTLEQVQDKVYYYRFNWDQEPTPWDDVYGAAHGFDLPFLFSNFSRDSVFSNVIGGTANKPGRLALSEAMLGSLAAFARTGDPNNDELGVDWKPWPNYLELDASNTEAQITVKTR